MKTNKNLLNVALCALVAMALPAVAGGQQLKTLGGHVPLIVSRFHLQPVGELPGDTNLNLAISLPVQNETELNTLLSQIYDPASPNYHHFLNRGEFAQRFGPSAGDYQKVLDFAKANNLEIVRSYSNQMLLDVSGKASDIENAFHVKLYTFHHPTENRTFFAPASDPAVDSSMPIEHISGLDSYVVPRPLLHPMPMTQQGKKTELGSGPGGTYMGKDFRAAYAPGVTLDGTGQNVGLFELDGYFTADILSYEAQAGLPNLTLTNIAVDGGVPNPTPFGDPEVSLDIEMDISMATNASEIIVYEAPNGFANSSVDMLNRIASDDLAKQISSSWGIGDDPAFDVYYKEMAVQGQSFFQASGDLGAYYPGIPEWADDTNITLVGGTTLSTAGPVGAWTAETVWNWWNEFAAFGGSGGSGGGTNINGVPIPSWQQNVVMTNNQGSTTLRTVPDVALTADNIYVIYENGFSGGFGGTSCAAPLWAAYTALVNQQAISRGQSTVGFLNPAIYAIGLGANYTNCFHDIVTGNNTNDTVFNAYDAVPGYDLATGWGTPNGSNLINALTAFASTNVVFTHLSPPAPPYGSTLTVLNGGNPNGNWELFGLDDQGFNYGGISNGWILTLTTANPIGNVADVDLTMTASATNLTPGSLVNFYLGVENYGPDASSNVVVLDDLPIGFTFVNASPTVGTVTNLGQTLTWNVTGTNSLANNTGAELTLSMLAPSSQEQAVNSALVTSTTPDPNPADASADVVVNVTLPTQPLLASSGVGSDGTFHLTISNTLFPVVIQASTNMINWVNIYTNYPGSTSYVDSVKSGVPARFYRAFVQ